MFLSLLYFTLFGIVVNIISLISPFLLSRLSNWATVKTLQRVDIPS